MRGVLALAILSVGLGCTWTATGIVLPAGDRDRLTRSLTAFALGVGLLTLLLFALLLARPGRSPFAWAFATCAALLCGGLLHPPRATRPQGVRPDRGARWGLPEVTLAAAIAIWSGGALLNAALWPFDASDALAVYAPMSRHVFERWTLPEGEGLYEAYPQLVPLSYAFAHWAHGGTNEQLARVVATLMALGAVGAAGALGRAMGSPRVGLGAAALMVLTPVFGRWASSGYTDVPGGFFLGLSALFAWRWRREGDRRAALLAGVMAGLAMWTRNSTLVGVVSLALVIATRRFALCTLAPSSSPRQVWAHAGLMLAAALAIAGPWYARNLVVFGVLVPPTVWSNRAHHGLDTLALMLRSDQHFGGPGWLFTVALAYAGLRAARHDWARGGAWHVLVAYALPFLAAWFWYASYETRFLMTILPLMAVMAALMLADSGGALLRVLPRVRPRALLYVAAGGVVLLLPLSLRKTVEHKAALLDYRWLDDDARHRVRIGGLYEVARYLNRLPRGSRVIGVPPMIRFHLDLERFATIDWASAATLSPGRAPLYDYAVWRPDDGSDPPVSAGLRAAMRTRDGYIVYAIPREQPGRAPGTEPDE